VKISVNCLEDMGPICGKSVSYAGVSAGGSICTSYAVSSPPLVKAYALPLTCSTRHGGTYGLALGASMFPSADICRSNCLRDTSKAAAEIRLDSSAAFACCLANHADNPATPSETPATIAPMSDSQSEKPIPGTLQLIETRQIAYRAGRVTA
jgi:hypothetical protein